MVRYDEEGSRRRHTLATLNDEPAGRLLDDPRRAVMHSHLAEGAVVHDEAAGDVIRDGPHEPAHDLHTEARLAADQRLGALPRDDLRNLSALADELGGLRVRVSNAFEHVPRISRTSNLSVRDGILANAPLPLNVPANRPGAYPALAAQANRRFEAS